MKILSFKIQTWKLKSLAIIMIYINIQYIWNIFILKLLCRRKRNSN